MLQDSDVIVWPLMDVVEDDVEGVEVCALCRFRERRGADKETETGGVLEGAAVVVVVAVVARRGGGGGRRKRRNDRATTRTEPKRNERM